MTSDSAFNPADEAPLVGHRRLLASAAMLATATVLVKLVALVKDWMVARQFGAGDELDAYLIAFMIPSYGVAVLGHSFAQAFLPTYLRVYRQESPAAARHLVGGVLAGGTLLLCAVVAALALVAPGLLRLVGSGFDPATLELAHTLLYAMLGVLVVGGISSILAAVLNSHERFAAAAIAPLAVPLATVVAFASLADCYGMLALAGGTLAGFVLECLVLLIAAGRLGLVGLPRAGALDARLLHIASRYWPIVVATLLMSSAAVVDQSMAASLASGNVSVLSYGNKLVALALSIGAVSLSTVLFPRFSHLITAGQWQPLERMLAACTRWIFLGSVPVVVVLTLLAEPMIRLLFERGAFTPETTTAVSRVQVYLALQIPFYVLAMFGARLLSALDANRVVLRIAALNLAVNVAGNYALMQWFGVDGIAMATSLAYLAAAVATLVAVRTKMADARA